ncbi:MAG: PAS domain S-box protein [Candidatus Verstraetearchaeota archaeon]|nr:PAS domain S-box protein [Candidatus Verstraetearchaeota archaeon]
MGSPEALKLYNLAASLAEALQLTENEASVYRIVSETFSASGDCFVLIFSKSQNDLKIEAKSRHKVLNAVEFPESVPYETVRALSDAVSGKTRLLPLEEVLREVASTTVVTRHTSTNNYSVVAIPLSVDLEVTGVLLIGAAEAGGEFVPPAQLIARIVSMNLERLKRWSSPVRPKGEVEWNIQLTRTLLNTVPGGVFFRNKDFIFEDCNREFERIVGLPKEQILGKTVNEVLPENAQLIKQRDLELIRDGRGVQTCQLVLKVDSTPRHYLVKKSLVLDTSGSLCGIIGVITDITELKSAERELQTSKDLLNAIIESIPDPVFVLDKNRKVIAWNKAIEEMTAISKESIMGKDYRTYSPLFYGEPRPLLVDLLFESESAYERQYSRFERGSNWALAEGYVNSKRGRIYVIAHATLIHDSAGNLLGGIETFKDITDHKELEESLKQSEERYRAIVDDLLEAVIRFKPDGEITFLNDNFARLLGVEKESLLGKNFLLIIPRDYKEKVEGFLKRIKETPVAQITERVVGADGEERWIMWIGRAIFDRRGSVAEIQATGRDVTEMKQFEEKLESIVEERTKKLREAEGMAMLGQIAASVGHDLRNPMQSILYNTYLIGAAASNRHIPPKCASEILELLSKIERQVNYMNNIVSDLSDLTKSIALKPREVDVPSLINDALSMVRIPSKIRVVVNVATKNPVCLDENMIARALVNLIKNAIEAMPEGGELQVCAYDGPNSITLEVKDTGIGIPEDSLKKIFTPLYTTKPGGSGLGLVICKRIVEAHGGRISVESQVGKGTSFKIDLPVKLSSGEFQKTSDVY